LPGATEDDPQETAIHQSNNQTWSFPVDLGNVCRKIMQLDITPYVFSIIFFNTSMTALQLLEVVAAA
jgi:hypothetical protein